MICECIFGESDVRELLLDADKDREIACRLIEVLKWLQDVRDGEVKIQSSRDYRPSAPLFRANHIKSAVNWLEYRPQLAKKLSCGKVLFDSKLDLATAAGGGCTQVHCARLAGASPSAISVRDTGVISRYAGLSNSLGIACRAPLPSPKRA